MKILLPFFLFLFTAPAIVAAQAPEQPTETKSTAPGRPLTNQPAGDPAVAEAQQTIKRFTLQTGRLREAFTAKDAGTLNAFYPGTLLTIRQGIEQLEKQRLAQIELATAAATSDAAAQTTQQKEKPVPAAAPAVVAAEKRVVRGREILAAFEGFEFKTDNAEAAENKFALLTEFQRLLQENLASLKKK